MAVKTIGDTVEGVIVDQNVLVFSNFKSKTEQMTGFVAEYTYPNETAVLFRSKSTVSPVLKPLPGAPKLIVKLVLLFKNLF